MMDTEMTRCWPSGNSCPYIRAAFFSFPFISFLFFFLFLFYHTCIRGDYSSHANYGLLAVLMGLIVIKYDDAPSLIIEMYSSSGLWCLRHI